MTKRGRWHDDCGEWPLLNWGGAGVVGSGSMSLRERQTSYSHPLRVDEIPAGLLVGGRLGMTIAPGKMDLNGYTGAHDRTLATDLDVLFETFAPTWVISLMEGFEYERFKIPTLLTEYTLRGARVLHYPIVDMRAPTDMKVFSRVIDLIDDELRAGESVMVHCKGGLGRTGVVVASVLVRQGVTPAAAVALTRKHRVGSIQTADQEEWVYTYAQECGGAR